MVGVSQLMSSEEELFSSGTGCCSSGIGPRMTEPRQQVWRRRGIALRDGGSAMTVSAGGEVERGGEDASVNG